MKTSHYLTLLILLFSFNYSLSQEKEELALKYSPVDKELHNTIVQMDSIFFHAYNTCDLETQDTIISDDIEFFHDKGGLITSKQELLSGMKNNICGKVTRTLVKGTIEVYPINNYGAIQIGYHTFFNKEEPNEPQHPGKFIHVWKKASNGWKITKVISLH